MDFIYKGIGWLLSLFNSWTGNYVVALLIFAVFAKLILLPLDIKQQKNSIKQAKLRPKEMAIRNKYKGRTDRATQMKLQQEIQDLYQREGYSMFGGCLPLLIQFPIIIILYGVIRNPLQYIVGCSLENVQLIATALGEITGSSFNANDQISMLPAVKANFDALIEKLPDIGFIVEDLPNFDVFGIDTGFSPQQFTADKGSILNIMMLIPVLNFVMQFATTKILKKFQPQPVIDDPSQKTSMNIMEITLPLMTVYFAFIMNGAIGIYWMFNNVVSLVERFIIVKLMPLPQYTEEEIKQIQKAMKKDTPSSAARPERRDGEKPRSLHRIDEDDDDVPPPPKKKSSPKADDAKDEAEKVPTEEEKKNAAIADKVIGEAPALKDESDKYNRKKK